MAGDFPWTLHNPVPPRGGRRRATFAEAEVVVRRRLTNNRVAPAPLEGRVVLSEFDPASGRLVHHTASQLPHVHARSLGACLGLPLRKLQLVAFPLQVARVLKLLRKLL